MRVVIVFFTIVLLATLAMAEEPGKTGADQMPMPKHGGGGRMQMPKEGHGTGHEGMRAADPSQVDYATARWSEHRRFQISYRPSRVPVPINTIQSWTLTITDSGGRPVDGAVIEIAGDMPEHGHGLPTTPQVRSLGGGRYMLEGLKFHMPGWWVVTLDVSAAGRSDTVTFNLKLQ